MNLKLRNRLKSTREQIRIKNIEDGILILPGNKFRKILKISPINFELKSEAEKEEILEGYKNFLNSLEGNIQIISKVREKNIDDYVSKLKMNSANESEPIYKKLNDDYIKFVSSLVVNNKILTRYFYIVLSFDGGKKDNLEIAKKSLIMEKNNVVKSLSKIGVGVTELESSEIFELYGSFYIQDKEKLLAVTELFRQLKEGEDE